MSENAVCVPHVCSVSNWRMSRIFYIKRRLRPHNVHHTCWLRYLGTSFSFPLSFLNSIMKFFHCCFYTFPRFLDCITFYEKPHTMTSGSRKPNNPAQLPEPSHWIRVWMNHTTLPFSSHLPSCPLQNQSKAIAHIFTDKRGDSERKVKRL